MTPEGFPYDDFVGYFPQLSPEKSDNTAEFIVGCGNRAMMYLSRWESAWLSGRRKTYAICLLAAHVVYLTNKTDSEVNPTGAPGGGQGDASVGPVTSASVGGVSVSMQTPASASQDEFRWWLNKSPYGQEFLALIKTRGPKLAFVGSRTAVLPLR